MITSNSVSALVLAAGKSQRFGADKLLTELEVGSKSLPLITLSLQPWLEAFEVVTLVVRADHQVLKQVLQDTLATDFTRIRFIVNEHADAGMGHSLAAGVAANKQASSWLVGLADMPLLPPQVLNDSIALLQSGARLTAPFFEGRRGHPVGFSNHYFDTLIALTGDQGGRDILQRDKLLLQQINAPDTRIFIDIDRPEDIRTANISLGSLADR